MEEKQRCEQFFKDMEEWLQEQMIVFTMATDEAEKAFAKDNNNMNAASAIVTYQSRLQAYEFMLGKFENFHKGKKFHDLPDELMSGRQY